MYTVDLKGIRDGSNEQRSPEQPGSCPLDTPAEQVKPFPPAAVEVPMDLNALHQAGLLPDDPFEGAVPMDEPAPRPKAERSAPAEQPPIDLARVCLPLTDPTWGAQGWMMERPAPCPMLLTTTGSDRRPFLPMGKVALLAAAGGSGKTQALAQLAVVVASAGPATVERRCWLDAFQVDRPAGNVLWACGEEDRDEVRRRLQRSARGLQLTEEELVRLEQHLWPLPLYGWDARLLAPDTRSLSPFADALMKFLLDAHREWSLIILDPGSRFMGPDDEKDNGAATRFVEAVEGLTLAPGGPVVLIAMHTGKQVRESAGRAGDDQYMTRGSSAFVDGARWAATIRWVDLPKGVELEGPTRFLQFTHTKSNYTRKAAPLHLAMDGEGFLRAATAPELASLCRAQESARELAKGRGKSNGAAKPGGRGEVVRKTDEHIL